MQESITNSQGIFDRINKIIREVNINGNCHTPGSSTLSTITEKPHKRVTQIKFLLNDISFVKGGKRGTNIMDEQPPLMQWEIAPKNVSRFDYSFRCLNEGMGCFLSKELDWGTLVK